eukprot:CAMPEP_0171422580 /NCGR_PEP_ID=MMETSP0881-20121228/1369_1 /TAXON_ID=67004 /ORGANISM="Thalassiosira weissflogii, Strain CCMP1336" /LENGTH=47 /DNA_ID= /DNA_START= /DNA_END= /DNA_ORIENTATION=
MAFGPPKYCMKDEVVSLIHLIDARDKTTVRSKEYNIIFTPLAATIRP